MDLREEGRTNKSFRVLVVDDYEPWHGFVLATLRKQPDLEIIGNLSDGCDAVEQVGRLKPDLILLDIGLPKLNGIEAARQIRKLSLKSKIIVCSQETSLDIVQEALNTGANGYV